MEGSSSGEKKRKSRGADVTERPPRGTPDNRKPVLQLDRLTREVVEEYKSQQEAAAAVGGNESSLSLAIRDDAEYMGSLWQRALTGASGSGAGARCFRGEKRSEHRSGRHLVVGIDIGHSGSGYAMDYKGPDGLCPLCQMKRSALS